MRLRVYGFVVAAVVIFGAVNFGVIYVTASGAVPQAQIDKLESVISDENVSGAVDLTQQVRKEICVTTTDAVPQAQINKLENAIFNEKGNLKRPENIESWVFLGSSLGLTYSDAVRDPDKPGFFSSVFMEPNAYKLFMQTGKFADGTVFAKILYRSKLEDGGVSMGKPVYLEVHVKDRERFPETVSGFYAWAPNDPDFAEKFPVSMGCVACHQERAAYDDVFTQFYPTIRDRADSINRELFLAR